VETKQTIKLTITATVVMHCPYCGQAIAASQRLPYPDPCVGQFASVYRCRCGKHLGEPTKGGK
jgi:DNA-directed RNA polymerase subunit RPC12/RpoP